MGTCLRRFALMASGGYRLIRAQNTGTGAGSISKSLRTAERNTAR